MSYCVLVSLLVSMAASSYAVKYFAPCDASADCIALLTQSKCEHIFTSASCTKGYCSTVLKPYGQSCGERNAVCGTTLTCTSSACACTNSTYVYRSAIAMCVDPANKVFGEACTQSTDCYNGRGDTNAMTCSTTCHCDTGYVHRSGFCHIPHLGEACTASIGCTTMDLPLPTNISRTAETCSNGMCSCPSSTDQYTASYDGTSYSYCLVPYVGTLKMDGTTCTLHNECDSKICAACNSDTTITKRCLRVNTSRVSGVSGIQATTGVLLTLVALKVTLI